MSGLASIPTTRPAGPTSRASSHASRPGPQPTSSPRSPGRAPSAARVRARCSTISGAAYAFSRRRTSPGPKRGDAMGAENHTTAAAARAAAPSAREPEEGERVVAEDLPLDLRRQATVPGPPPLLVVVVGDQREVRAEDDPVLVAQQLGVGDRRAADAHVAFGQRAE